MSDIERAKRRVERHRRGRRAGKIERWVTGESKAKENDKINCKWETKEDRGEKEGGRERKGERRLGTYRGLKWGRVGGGRAIKGGD